MVKLAIIRTEERSRMSINRFTGEITVTEHKNESDFIWKNATIEITGLPESVNTSKIVDKIIESGYSNRNETKEWWNQILRNYEHLINDIIYSENPNHVMLGVESGHIFSDEFLRINDNVVMFANPIPYEKYKLKKTDYSKLEGVELEELILKIVQGF